MADKRKGKKRKEEFPDPDEKEKVEKPSKEEYQVANWLKNNVPIKKTKFLNHNVQYFTGVKAVDALMSSKWGKSDKEGEEPFFVSREHCIDFLDMMLRHKFFHRARKVPVSEEQLRAKKKKDKDKKHDDKKAVEEKDKEKKEEDLAESSHAEGKETAEGDEDRKKKKKKIRLEMHMDQYFADNLDAYVWIYDPIPIHYWLFGALVVLAAIGICMFPLWPPGVRMVVYYLSVAAAGFLVLIIVLAVLRFIVFSIIWILTSGRHHLWLFPNLTEDVGFFASFWPLYHYEYKGDEPSTSKKKKKKEKLSDNEDEEELQQKGISKKEESEVSKKEVKEEPETQKEVSHRGDGDTGGDGDGSGTESESSSQQSQTGKDFEMVDREEVTAQEEDH